MRKKKVFPSYLRAPPMHLGDASTACPVPVEASYITHKSNYTETGKQKKNADVMRVSRATHVRIDIHCTPIRIQVWG